REPKDKSEAHYAAEVLFVLLVPETPTKGIAGEAFNAALNLARLLSSEGRIGLLTPTFSGSFESLTRFVSAWDSAHPHVLYQKVYGGSISSASSAKGFRKNTKFEFYSGIANSDAYQNEFRSILDRYKIKPKDAAYWVEEDSGLGGAFRQDTNETPLYTFPREI